MCCISTVCSGSFWQKDIKSSTQDFLSQVTTTIDQQYLITGSSIQSNKQNNGYDFHLVKLNQQGEQVWENTFPVKTTIIYHLFSQHPGGWFFTGRYFLFRKRLRQKR
jgi:hypothetical protein